MKIGIFPGSFDPFTKGHESIVMKALEVFDEIVIAIGVNSKKQSFFTLEKRKNHIESLFDDRVRVISFEGLTVELCKKMNCKHLVRGLRDVKDFEYERSIAQMNRALYPIETIFFLTDNEFSSINASIVREIAINGGDITPFVTNPGFLV
ncbi:MAG: pantetheine-phosphate adenylyltransferase [Crocinitomicaceae bacterium]|nr:pantetheine-phosphate adenylyltransferase [Crocinitomicaceae bacterium]MCF8409846.1 pantetheine-phosphate adenylyltransferase [Crocinitomicaceae bacterium]